MDTPINEALSKAFRKARAEALRREEVDRDAAPLAPA